jgi:hypothetical protein
LWWWFVQEVGLLEAIQRQPDQILVGRYINL